MHALLGLIQDSIAVYVVDVMAISTCHGTYLITVRLSSQT